MSIPAIRFVTPKMLEAFLPFLVNPMDRALLVLAREGLRAEDIAGLTIEDVAVEYNTINVPRKSESEVRVQLLDVEPRTVQLCVKAQKQTRYSAGLLKGRRAPEAELVKSAFIVRPLLADGAAPYLTKSAVQQRASALLSPENTGLEIHGGADAVRIGKILSTLYRAEQDGEEMFERCLQFICDKFYFSALRPPAAQKELGHLVTEGVYQKYKNEFQHVFENERQLIAHMKAAASAI